MDIFESNVFNYETLYLFTGAFVLIILVNFISRAYRHKKSNSPEPPGPKPWPIIGSLHIFWKYEVRYMAFADLAKHYNSDVIKLKLGSVSCVVVNGLQNIKEVLITKGHDFDSRPNFKRYHQLFSGDKNNSLAFSDWSDVQQTRRHMLIPHTFPPMNGKNFKNLNDIVATETSNLVSYISANKNKIILKQLMLYSCANVFSRYFCSKSFEFGDLAFCELIRNFDKIFYEINQGYAVDFLPFFTFIYYRYMSRMADCSKKIREFIKKNIIEHRPWNAVGSKGDYVDCLLNHNKTNSEPYLSLDMALFALEDIIGGHSAIGNLLVRIFGCLVKRSDVQEAALREIELLKIDEGQVIGLKDKKSLPYIEAIILETIRLIASPIVPHVANKDSSIADYNVEKDTFIFLNNYGLSMSEDLWDNPKEFKPQRFIKEGKLTKPDHFLPFGGGKRKCMGYKIVENLSFSIVANVLKNFRILPIENTSYEVPMGNLAMPEVTFECKFEERTIRNEES